jgi:hypothetical protein
MRGCLHHNGRKSAPPSDIIENATIDININI